MRCDLCSEKNCRKLDPCIKTESEPLYEDSDEMRILRAAAEVETLFYGNLCRFDEILEFARRLSYRKLGLAFCVAMAEEASCAAEIISREFELVSVCCKVGGLSKEHLGMPLRPWVSAASCNPAEQARILDEAGCELNIVLGLCVGHDVLFYRHSKAPATTLAVKDRRLGHNPLAALYVPLLRRSLGSKPVERTQ